MSDTEAQTLNAPNQDQAMRLWAVKEAREILARTNTGPLVRGTTLPETEDILGDLIELAEWLLKGDPEDFLPLVPGPFMTMTVSSPDPVFSPSILPTDGGSYPRRNVSWTSAVGRGRIEGETSPLITEDMPIWSTEPINPDLTVYTNEDHLMTVAGKLGLIVYRSEVSGNYITRRYVGGGEWLLYTTSDKP